MSMVAWLLISFAVLKSIEEDRTVELSEIL